MPDGTNPTPATFPPHCPTGGYLPQLKHTPHAGIQIPGEDTVALIFGEPLEVGDTIGVILGQVDLPGHDAALEVEGLDTACNNLAGGLVELGRHNVVRDGHTADDPRIHVDAGGFGEDAGRGLSPCPFVSNATR